MRDYRSLKWIFSTLILLVLLVGCNAPTDDGGGPPPPGQAPTGDYGDAPDGGTTDYPDPFVQDGQFPTLFASNGARTLKTDEATLGPSASDEVDANDPADPDGAPNLTNTDSDDGLVNFFITLTAIPPPTTLSVEVFAPAGSPGGTFYVNAIIDLNMDGQWGGQGANGELEWVVQNQPVQVVPGGSTPFTSPPFAFSNGNLLPDGAYMRLALTKERVPGNWDGTGEFSSGEIEDHFIKLPQFGGKEGPILSVDCNGPYTPTSPVFCTVTNLRPVAGNFTYTLRWIGGGSVNVPIATCAPGAPAGGPVPIGASGVVVITCASTAGTTPTTWQFTAKVKDPPAVVVDGGIELGHSEESTAEFEFEGQKVWSVYVGYLMGMFEHFSDFSRVLVDVVIYGDDPVPMEGASVTLTMKSPGGGTETQTVVTDAEGQAHVEFDIFVYGRYEVTVDNIEGEGMAYKPMLNSASSVEVNVGSEVETFEGLQDVPSFVAALNSAFAAGDVGALLQGLHPAVIDLYDTEACMTYLWSIIENPIQLEVLEVTALESWLWERDGVSTEVPNAFAVGVNRTVQEQTDQIMVHFARREAGSLSWFTDCGDPLE
jgi:hypothetical protein